MVTKEKINNNPTVAWQYDISIWKFSEKYGRNSILTKRKANATLLIVFIAISILLTEIEVNSIDSVKKRECNAQCTIRQDLDNMQSFKMGQENTITVLVLKVK